MDLQSESLKDSISYVNSVSSLSRLLIPKMAQERRNIKEKSETSLMLEFLFQWFCSQQYLTLNFQKLFLLVAAIFGFINISFNVIEC